MKKIDGVTAGPNNTFVDYNPGAGIGGTILTADWLNINREEIINVIEGAGLTLDANDDEQLSQAIQAIIADYVGGGVPSGGTTSQALVKTNLNTDNAATWQTFAGLTGNVPTGGTTGQLLKKVNSTDYNTTWGTVAGLNGSIPTGGTTSQALAKNSGTNYDLTWLSGSSLGLLATGGSAGEILAKNSGTNYDVGWKSLLTLKGAKYGIFEATVSSGIIASNECIRFTNTIASSGVTYTDTSSTNSGAILASGSNYLVMFMTDMSFPAGSTQNDPDLYFYNNTGAAAVYAAKFFGSGTEATTGSTGRPSRNICAATVIAGSGQSVGIRNISDAGDSGSIAYASYSDPSNAYKAFLVVVSLS